MPVDNSLGRHHVLFGGKEGMTEGTTVISQFESSYAPLVLACTVSSVRFVLGRLNIAGVHATPGASSC